MKTALLIATAWVAITSSALAIYMAWQAQPFI